MSEPPKDALGEYQGNREITWIKDIDPYPPWPMGRLWSSSRGLWRLKREHIGMDRVRLFQTSEGCTE